MTKDKNIKKEKKATKINKKIETKTKRKKINLVNILIILLAFSLLFSLILKNKESLKNILIKTNKQKADQTYTGKDLKIGDIVYYNHEVTKLEGKNEYVPVEQNKLTVKLPNGSAKYPGTGNGHEQTYTAKDQKTVWRVWDINKTTGEVTLISETLKGYTNKGAIGYIWEEYNMHKVASTFGHGYGANINTKFTNTTSRKQNFTYKVGSGLENTGDTARWKIGEEPDGIEKIKKSGTRALTLDDVEEKLGIDDIQIKTGKDKNGNSNGISANEDEGYGNIVSLNIYFPQRELEGLTQNWEDKTIAKAGKQDVKAKNRYYSWEKSKIPDSIYKELIWKNWQWYCLATTTLRSGYSYTGFESGALVGHDKLFSHGFELVFATSPGHWIEKDVDNGVRPLTFLKPDLTYYGKPDLDPNKTNEWDIIKPTIENKKVEIGNYQNIDFEPKINLVQNANKIPLTKENNKYIANVEYKTGIERQGKGDEAEFVEPTNKYTLQVENLPSGYTFEIEGKTNKEIDIKDKTSYTLIFKKDNKEIATRPAEASELNIGDIVYYNHKKAADINNEKNQKVTIEKGTAATPGYGGKDDRTAPQEFDAKNENTTWRVWDKLPDGRVMLVSNSPVAKFYTGYGIGHIWWEHNAHKISSIFGYGYGADTNATKDFSYKVGSGIDNAPDMIEGDKGNWKIGQNGVDVSGSRSITMPDIEQKLGITEEDIKKGTNGINIDRNDSDWKYGTSGTPSIKSVVQRDIGSRNQIWEDKTKAIAKNNSYTMTDKHYYWDKSNIPESSVQKPNMSKYKEMLFNEWTAVATNALDIYNSGSNVFFGRGSVGTYSYGAYGLGSSYYGFMASYGASWDEADHSLSFRVATFLKSNIQYIKVKNENNAWDIKATSEDENLKLSVLNFSEEVAGKIRVKVEKASAEGIAPEDATRDASFLGTVDGKEQYEAVIKKYSGQKRSGTGDNAVFSSIKNKYRLSIENLPEGYVFKILGKDNFEIDLDKETNLEYEAVIYPKNYTVPVEYSKGENAEDFAVSGKLKLMNGNTEVKSQTVKLEHKKGTPNKTFVTLKDIDMFNNTTNELNEYEVVFEKTEGRHKVEAKSGKVTVTYVPEEMEINISAKSDGPITLDNITVNLVKKIVKKIGEEITREEITLENASGFTKKMTVPKTDEDGNLISYSLEKKSLNMGYITTISGYDVNLKAVLALPFTGSSANLKNAILLLGISVLTGFVFRFRKKLVFIFKNYTMMK